MLVACKVDYFGLKTDRAGQTTGLHMSDKHDQEGRGIWNDIEMS